MDPGRFRTHSLRDARVHRVLAAAIDAADPRALVRAHLHQIPNVRGHTYVLGLGKAAPSMCGAVMEAVPVHGALVITKHPAGSQSPNLRVLTAGHPIPDERSVRAASEALEFVGRLRQDDLLICVISGGGSTLAVAPRRGITLLALQEITQHLLLRAATITEINAVRKCLDRIKAGGLAAATRAAVLGLILSDVPGGSAADVASGPTAEGPDPTEKAQAVISRYDLPLSPAIQQALRTPRERRDPNAGPLHNVVIGDNLIAAEAALREAQREGFRAALLEGSLQGEARSAGVLFAEMISQAPQQPGPPMCLMATGETTVTVVGNGRGGRNQELVLAAVPALSQVPGGLLVSLATDGEDGATDAAGAVATETSLSRGQRLGMQPAAYLTANDSYRYFEALGDLLKPGITGTNVNDLCLLIREPR